MAKQIFVNLPVKDLKKSRAFFAALGFNFNEQFSNDDAFCMVISDNIFAMMLREEFFKTFTPREICDTTKSRQVLIALDASSREEVDEMVKKAIENGGSTYSHPQDHGWMYQHAFADIDGHQWEFAYMDMSAVPQQM